MKHFNHNHVVFFPNFDEVILGYTTRPSLLNFMYQCLNLMGIGSGWDHPNTLAHQVIYVL